mmetsp:Transcript_12966/g.31231  ORF Transcript_12966/g.31231 Transcript_12966/m.31231 type:complete len:210 (-) Transcript_12966:251-880(-)
MGCWWQASHSAEEWTSSHRREIQLGSSRGITGSRWVAQISAISRCSASDKPANSCAISTTAVPKCVSSGSSRTWPKACWLTCSWGKGSSASTRLFNNARTSSGLLRAALSIFCTFRDAILASSSALVTHKSATAVADRPLSLMMASKIPGMGPEENPRCFFGWLSPVSSLRLLGARSVASRRKVPSGYSSRKSSNVVSLSKHRSPSSST